MATLQASPGGPAVEKVTLATGVLDAIGRAEHGHGARLERCWPLTMTWNDPHWDWSPYRRIRPRPGPTWSGLRCRGGFHGVGFQLRFPQNRMRSVRHCGAARGRTDAGFQSVPRLRAAERNTGNNSGNRTGSAGLKPSVYAGCRGSFDPGSGTSDGVLSSVGNRCRAAGCRGRRHRLGAGLRLTPVPIADPPAARQCARAVCRGVAIAHEARDGAGTDVGGEGWRSTVRGPG
jgi:hypothetical protein